MSLRTIFILLACTVYVTPGAEATNSRRELAALNFRISSHDFDESSSISSSIGAAPVSLPRDLTMPMRMTSVPFSYLYNAANDFADPARLVYQLRTRARDSRRYSEALFSSNLIDPATR